MNLKRCGVGCGVLPEETGVKAVAFMPFLLTKVNHFIIIKVNHLYGFERMVTMIKEENTRIAVLIVPEVKEGLEKVIEEGKARTYSGAVRFLMGLGIEAFRKQKKD